MTQGRACSDVKGADGAAHVGVSTGRASFWMNDLRMILVVPQYCNDKIIVESNSDNRKGQHIEVGGFSSEWTVPIHQFQCTAHSASYTVRKPILPLIS